MLIRNGLLPTFLIFAILLPNTLRAQATTDDHEIRTKIIEQSIREYPGNCPCPYNRAKNGSRCGKRSAWSRQGGYHPVCYPDDVTKNMIERFRKGNRPNG